MDQGDERARQRADEQERSARPSSQAGDDTPAEALRRRAEARVDERSGRAERPRGGSGAALAVGGFEFAAVLLVFVFLGQWLDRRLGTAPVFLLVCVFVGFAGATFSMYRRLTAAQAREDAERRARNGTSKQ